MSRGLPPPYPPIGYLGYLGYLDTWGTLDKHEEAGQL